MLKPKLRFEFESDTRLRYTAVFPLVPEGEREKFVAGRVRNLIRRQAPLVIPSLRVRRFAVLITGASWDDGTLTVRGFIDLLGFTD